MTDDSSDRVRERFSANARDWTPAPSGRAVQVLYAPVSHDPEVTKLCASVLPEVERQRAERFAAERDGALFVQRRAFRRFCGDLALASSRPLSEITFNETANGRSYLADQPDHWFSFSSCHFGFAGVWSANHGVGVDLEDSTRHVEATELAQKFFSVAEAKAVEEPGGLASRQLFFQLWSLKEAALKSIGEGLPFGLDAFEFELEPILRVVHAPPDRRGPAQFSAHILEGTATCAALVVRRIP